MGVANLHNDSEEVLTGKDSVVIVSIIETIRGGRSLNVTDYKYDVLRAGHVIIKETSSGDHKPMPATETAEKAINTFGSITAGTGFANGTYTNVPLQGGSGSGALATVVVSGAVVTGVTKTKGGSGYVVGDVLTIPAEYAGGTGSGASIPVASVQTVAGAYGALPAGHEYVGVLISSILTKKAMAGILVHGTVNPVAAPFPMTSILSAFKTATENRIAFRED